MATIRTVVDGLRSPNSVAFDTTGSLIIGSWFGPIWRLTAEGGLQTVVETAPAPSFLTGIAVDGEGRVYASDWWGHRVLRFDGQWSVAVDEGLNHPLGVAVDRAGNLYIADSSNRRIRVVRTDGSAATVADGVHASGITADTAGNVYFVDYPSAIRKIAADGH